LGEVAHERELSVRALARALGISDKALGSILRGERAAIHGRTFQCLARAGAWPEAHTTGLMSELWLILDALPPKHPVRRKLDAIRAKRQRQNEVKAEWDAGYGRQYRMIQGALKDLNHRRTRAR
jgi:transcriptional regulator with XRE-family HTH domain